MEDSNFLMYIAGFFDGEGHCRIQKYRVKGKEYSRLVVKITQVDRRPLDKIVEYFGCGVVVSNHDGNSKHRVCHDAVFTNLSARKILVAIEPHLIVKKQHVTECLNISGRMLTRKNAKK